jgi:hypothetical protein
MVAGDGFTKRKRNLLNGTCTFMIYINVKIQSRSLLSSWEFITTGYGRGMGHVMEDGKVGA